MLAGGAISLGGDWQANNPVMLFTNGTWTALPNVNGQINSVAVYHDTIIVGGYIPLINDTVPCRNIAYWTAGGWRNYGDFDGVIRKLKVIDDTLYAGGGFHSVDGEVVGLNWTGFRQV